MRFVYRIEVEVERTEGKFASRGDLGEQIQAELESAEPSTLEGENGGIYEVTSFEVTQEEQVRR